MSIVKSRETRRNIFQERSIKQAWFPDYAEKLGALVVEAEDKNTNMITDKLYENDVNLKRLLKRWDEALSNASILQASNQAHLSQIILPPNKPNFIANVDSGIDDELLRGISKDYDPTES